MQNRAGNTHKLAHSKYKFVSTTQTNAPKHTSSEGKKKKSMKRRQTSLLTLLLSFLILFSALNVSHANSFHYLRIINILY